MSLVDSIASVLHDELKCHTGWPPIATKLSLGDYGVLDGNVFNKLGNLAALQIRYGGEEGPPARLDFTSADTMITRLVAGGEVNAFPAGTVEASLRVCFQSANALMIKAGSITVHAMPDVGVVAARLKKIHAPGWGSSNAVVGAVLTADKPMLIGTREAGTEVAFDGQTDALKSLDVGRFGAGIAFASNKELGLKILGESGVIGVRLFRLRLFGAQPRFLGPGAAPEAEANYEWLIDAAHSAEPPDPETSATRR
jgi:hypothetical protein